MGIRVSRLNRADDDQHIKAQLVDPYEALFAFPASSTVSLAQTDANGERARREANNLGGQEGSSETKLSG